jgi:hypothetical protein
MLDARAPAHTFDKPAQRREDLLAWAKAMDLYPRFNSNRVLDAALWKWDPKRMGPMRRLPMKKHAAMPPAWYRVFFHSLRDLSRREQDKSPFQS